MHSARTRRWSTPLGSTRLLVSTIWSRRMVDLVKIRKKKADRRKAEEEAAREAAALSSSSTEAQQSDVTVQPASANAPQAEAETAGLLERASAALQSGLSAVLGRG